MKNFDDLEIKIETSQGRDSIEDRCPIVADGIREFPPVPVRNSLL